MIRSLEMIDDEIAMARLRIVYCERALEVLRERKAMLENGERVPDGLPDALCLAMGLGIRKTYCGLYEEIISAYKRPMSSGEILAVAIGLGLKQRGARGLREEVRVALYRCKSLYRVRRDLWWFVGRDLPSNFAGLPGIRP